MNFEEWLAQQVALLKRQAGENRPMKEIQVTADASQIHPSAQKEAQKHVKQWQQASPKDKAKLEALYALPSDYLEQSVVGSINPVTRAQALQKLQNSFFSATNTPKPYAPLGTTFGQALAKVQNIVRNRELPAIPGKEAIPVGHSSPHLFTEFRFDPGIIGKGEGAAAWGPGLYTAENPKVYHDHYRNTLERLDEPLRLLNNKLPIDIDKLYEKRNNLGLSKEMRARIISVLDRLPKSYKINKTQEASQAYRRAYEQVKKRKELMERYLAGDIDQTNKHFGTIEDPHEFLANQKRILKGHLGEYNKLQSKLVKNFNYATPITKVATYEADLLANPDEIFDFSKHVTQQPSGERILAALNQFPNTQSSSTLADMLRTMPVGDSANPTIDMLNSYRNMVKGFKPSIGYSSLINNPMDILKALKEKGIVANKYPDGGSRSSQGIVTNNYTVNTPERLQIRDVYSFIAAALGLPTAAATLNKKPSKEPDA